MKLGSWSPSARRLLALVALVLAASTGSCVEDVGLVDRTSPNKIDKRLFEGVWLYSQTTMDVPFSSAISFVGEQPFLGGTRKVVFELQENWLVAFPVTETVQGSEADWKVHKVRKYWDPQHRDEFVEMYLGPPVARWPIESHFDVQRNYNTYNGAQSNEVVENTTDRPWYLRDYVRVSWAKQGITDFFFGLRGGVGSDSYYVGEEKPGDPDEMTLDYDGGYFDFVVRTNAQSAGQNRCSIYGLSPYDCAKAEVKVRHAFRRLDPRRDYEPIRYHNDEHQDRFGFFATERPFYDQDWGPSYKGSVAYANRWNLWLHTYDFQKPKDANGQELTVSCFVDKDCDRDAGQRCQKEETWFGDGYCAVPVARRYRERGLRPIIFHLNEDWHPDYMQSAYDTADHWSDVFKETVAWMYFYDDRGVETTRTCETHADCTNGLNNVLVDEQITVVDNGVPCHASSDCGTGTCAAGFCAVTRACSASAPCASGQTCSGGVCQEGGQPVLKRLATQTLHGSTVVYGGDATMVTHDNFPSSVRSALPSGHAWVRFVNLAPAAGSLGAVVNGAAIPGGAYDASLDLDPSDPATANFMVAAEAGSGAAITITSGGNTVASTTADIVANSHYLVVYNGTDIVIAGASFNQSSRGVRFLHAASGQGGLDFAVAGIKRGDNVQYRDATEYASSAGTIQRATVTVGGSRGDITCYHADTIGYCVGWPQQLTDADRDRVRQIKSELPEMFVLCENKFDAVAASETFSNADERMKHLGDARYTEANGYNPCGDASLVPHPELAKKGGDNRYSYFYWINEPQRSGPLGYGPSQADPDTGEVLNATANIYGGSMHSYAQYAKDLLDLVNGDLRADDVITGKWIREYLKNKAEEEDAETGSLFGALKSSQASASSPGARTDLDPTAALGAPAGQLDPAFARAKMMGLRSPRKSPHDYDFPEITEFLRNPKYYKATVEAVLPKVDPSYFHNRLAKIKGTWIEDLAMNDEIMNAAELVDPDHAMSSDELHAALSPTTWSTKYAAEKERQRLLIFAKNNLFMADFVDDALFGLAKEMKALQDEHGWSDEQVRLEIGKRMLTGVLEHEVGHTMGLRHNFSGSTDVFNFQDEYYKIRERELILCQSDSWCDDINSETCAIQSCTADGDCLAGTLCDAGKCSAPAADGTTTLVPTGVCSMPIPNTTPCTASRQCGDGAVCHENKCYTPRPQLVPRSFLTFNEKVQKRTEYQYSTIMDYGGRINSDIHGLGKYDYAAIRFGYGRLVDTYVQTDRVKARIERAAATTGSSPANYSFYNQSLNWPTRGTGFFHPFNYLSNYIGVEENLDRVPVPYDQAKFQQQMAVNDVREYLDVAYMQVPYAYCSDEYRGNMGCYYFDQGIDMGEMAAGATDQLEQYYIFDAFKRERLYYGSYGNPLGYYSRIMDRYMRILGDVGMYFGFYDILIFRYSWYEEWKDMPLGGRVMEQSALDAFDRLTDVLAAPAPGSYAYDADNDVYTNVSLSADAPGSAFNVPFGVGRFPYTQYGSELGYNYWANPLWFGSFWEKLASLVTLTDSTAYFADTAVGEQLNIGVGTSIGFNTVFSQKLNNFLGGLVAGDLDFYAGRLSNGKYVPPSLSRTRLQDTPVEPTLNNFTLKLYAALYGLAFLPAGFDPEFIDRMAVFLEGEASQFQDGASAQLQQFRFHDPIGGKTYLAYGSNYGTFGEAKVDAAAELIVRAQDLADDWALETDPVRKGKLQRQIGEIRDVLDVLRQLNHVYGTSTLGF